MKFGVAEFFPIKDSSMGQSHNLILVEVTKLELDHRNFSIYFGPFMDGKFAHDFISDALKSPDLEFYNCTFIIHYLQKPEKINELFKKINSQIRN